MKYFALCFLLMTATVNANPYDYRVIRVLDGDTVEFDAPFLPIELKKVLKLRIEGVDTPEKGSLAKCEAEKYKAESATRFTNYAVMAARKHQIYIESWDKYGGRVIGDLILDGKSLKQQLLSQGYAKPYDGGKKTSWCF